MTSGAVSFDAGWLEGWSWSAWLARAGIVPGTRFLVSPIAEYYVVLDSSVRPGLAVEGEDDLSARVPVFQDAVGLGGIGQGQQVADDRAQSTCGQQRG